MVSPARTTYSTQSRGGPHGWRVGGEAGTRMIIPGIKLSTIRQFACMSSLSVAPKRRAMLIISSPGPMVIACQLAGTLPHSAGNMATGPVAAGVSAGVELARGIGGSGVRVMAIMVALATNGGGDGRSRCCSPSIRAESRASKTVAATTTVISKLDCQRMETSWSDVFMYCL